MDRRSMKDGAMVAALAAVFLVVLSSGSWTAARAGSGPAGGEEPATLGMGERDALFNGWLKVRFAEVLPAVMRRAGIDMWLVICREHNEDPVYWTLVPQPSMFAWRLSMFVFTDRGPAAGVECLTVNRYGGGDLHKEFPGFFKPAWEPEDMDPWQRLARIVKERRPKKIGIDESATFAFADGLSASNKARLVEALGPEYAGRLVSAERLVVGWLETRTAAEIAFYPKIVAINHRVVAEAFSGRVITPGKTTIDDLEGWVRDRLAGLRLTTWFPPMFYIIRAGDAGPDRVIRRGDLLRCDVGVTYLGLNSDIQEVAYVLREGETAAPKGLEAALAKGNRLQDILLAEMREGRTGNEVLAAALARAKAEGLAARIYSHPIGTNGHAAGTRIGLPDMQGGVPGMGDYPLYPDTCFAIELGVRVAVPEWGGQEIQMALEEDAAFTRDGVRFLDGRQTRLILIR